MSPPIWSDAVAWYRVARHLETSARRAGFTVLTAGNPLRVTPDSSGRVRNVTQADFERAVPLLERAWRGEVNEASRNSSYIEAIVADLRSGSR